MMIKKTKITLLALSCFVVALPAQSQMRLSGVLDVGYGVSNGGDFTKKAGGKGKFQQWGNGKSQSVWVIDGTEELSSQTKIVFRLESSIDPESGTANRGFDRDAYVGVRNTTWGTLQAGRQMAGNNYMMAKYELSGRNNQTSVLNLVGVSPQTPRYNRDAFGRFNSALVYMSPNFAGFHFNTTLALKNDDIIGRGDKAKNIYELSAEYTYQKFKVAAAYRSKIHADTNHAWGIATMYDFGFATASAGFYNNNDKDDGKGYFLAVRVPVDAWQFGAQIAYNTDARILRNGDNVKVKPFAWELFTYYNLSKRTSLYLTVGGLDNDAEAFQRAQRNYSAVAGIIHRF